MTDPSLALRQARSRERFNAALMEAMGAPWVASFFNPLDELWDPHQRFFWQPIGGIPGSSAFDGSRRPGETDYFATDQGRDVVLQSCRWLGTEDTYAINLLDNLASYIVGEGMQFDVKSADEDDEVSDKDLAKVRAALREVVRDAGLHSLAKPGAIGSKRRARAMSRQSEMVRRGHRDGEVIVRRFLREDGGYEIRFVEPDAVRTPKGSSDAASARLGVETADGDVETVEAYWIDGDRVGAEEIHHLKLNADDNVKRGIPTLWAIRSNLMRASKLLRNMSGIATVQASIAMVRKHKRSPAAVEAFADRKAATTQRDPATGEEVRVFEARPAQIIDTTDQTEHEFPAVNIAADKLVAIHRAEILAAASRVQFPEFMFTSNAENANMASTIVSEGPAHKRLLREQGIFGVFMAEIIADGLRWKAEKGAFPLELLDRVAISPTGPEVVSRNGLEEAQRKEILHRNGIVSQQTWAREEGYDWEEEDGLLDEAASRGAFGAQAGGENGGPGGGMPGNPGGNGGGGGGPNRGGDAGAGGDGGASE